MPKSSKRKNLQTKSKRHKSKPVSKFERFGRGPKNWVGFIFRNILIGLMVAGSFKYIYEHKKLTGYTWLFEKFIPEQWETMKKNPDLAFEKRQQSKLGFFAKYLQFINENTPDSAIVLMPSPEVVKAIDKKYNLKWLSSKRHVGYMIYPRKPVYMNSKRDSIYLEKITHVAIVDGKGYDKLPYRVRNKQQFTILPVQIPQKQ